MSLVCSNFTSKCSRNYLFRAARCISLNGAELLDSHTVHKTRITVKIMNEEYLIRNDLEFKSFTPAEEQDNSKCVFFHSRNISLLH